LEIKSGEKTTGPQRKIQKKLPENQSHRNTQRGFDSQEKNLANERRDRLPERGFLKILKKEKRSGHSKSIRGYEKRDLGGLKWGFG